MENCLSANGNINVVYTINEPAADGAYQALKAAGKTNVLDRDHRRQLQVREGLREGRHDRRRLRPVPRQDGAARASSRSRKIAKGGAKPTTARRQGLHRLRHQPGHRQPADRRSPARPRTRQPRPAGAAEPDAVAGAGTRPAPATADHRPIATPARREHPHDPGRRGPRHRRGDPPAPGHPRPPHPQPAAPDAGPQPADRARARVHRLRARQRAVLPPGEHLDRPAAGRGRRLARRRTDTDHPHRRHRPVDRRGDGALHAGHGQAGVRQRRPGRARASRRHRHRRPRRRRSTASS